jgi:leucyl/phenylalanyl-tRNA--protein transferase
MAFRVRSISAQDPADSFPDPATVSVALGHPDGLVAIGGDLSSERLLAAYTRGIFPWFNEDQPVLWWSPEPRAVIYPEEFHLSRRFKKELRGGRWEYSLNQCFAKVIEGCAENRGEHGTWIVPAMREAFLKLHNEGYAHSVESWRDGEFAGGLYGLRLGRAFFAESMFTLHTGGSKVALAALMRIAAKNHMELVDCQLESAHLETLGMRAIPRAKYLAALPELTAATTAQPGWKIQPRPAAALAAGTDPATC